MIHEQQATEPPATEPPATEPPARVPLPQVTLTKIDADICPTRGVKVGIHQAECQAASAGDAATAVTMA